MTKGEQEAYLLLQNALHTLIVNVQSSYELFDYTPVLKTAINEARNAMSQAHHLFNKGKRKK